MIFLGAYLFLIVLLLHIIIWRLFKPKSEIKAICLLFVLIPLALFLFLLTFIDYQVITLTALILYFSLAGVYVQTYPCITTNIPSFRVLQEIDKAGKEGLLANEIKKVFASRELVDSRADLLHRDGLVTEAGKLSNFGNIMATIFIVYRRILGLEIGRG